jgi:copper chaperone CopZ
VVSILNELIMRTTSLKLLLGLLLVAALVIPEFVFAEEKAEANQELLQEYQLIVTGLTCKSCIPDVRKALKKVPGVRDARITKFDKAGSLTTVEVVPDKVSGEELVSALRSSGFYAKILAVGKPRKVLLKNEKESGFFSLFN